MHGCARAPQLSRSVMRTEETEVSRQRRGDDELRAVSGHLWYELQMFRATALGLMSGLFPGGPLHDAVLEAFIIHGRNLLHFLYPEKPQDSDVLAEDFLDDPIQWPTVRGDMPASLTSLRRRANKEVAHLTFDRLSVTQEEKGWHFVDILRDLDLKFHAFRRLVPAKRLAEPWSILDRVSGGGDA